MKRADQVDNKMRTKDILKTVILIGSFILLRPTYIYAQTTITPATADASGPTVNPIQNKLREMIVGDDGITGAKKQCYALDWDSSGSGKYSPHKFDRTADEAGVYLLTQLAEQVSMRAEVEDSRSNTTIWLPVNSQLRVIEPSLVTQLLEHPYRYMRYVLPNAHHFGSNTDKSFTNYQDYVLFPTTCGIFIFKRYKKSCWSLLSSEEIPTVGPVTHNSRVQLYDDSITNDPGKTINDFYILVGFEHPESSLVGITNALYNKEMQPYQDRWLATLQNTATVLELIPFVSSGTAIFRLADAWTYQAYGPITNADQLGIAADVLLDALPYIAQARKARAASLTVYALGSSAILAANVARTGMNGQWEIQDTLRLVVLSIAGNRLRMMAMPRVDTVARSVEPSIRIPADFTRGMNAMNITSEASLNAATQAVRTSSAYKIAIKQYIADIMKPFTIPSSTSVTAQGQALISAMKLDRSTHMMSDLTLEQYYLQGRAFAKGIKQARGAGDTALMVQRMTDYKAFLVSKGNKTLVPAQIEPDSEMWDRLEQARLNVKQKMATLGLNPRSPQYQKKVDEFYYRELDGMEIGTAFYQKNLLSWINDKVRDIEDASYAQKFPHGSAYYHESGNIVYPVFDTPSFYYVNGFNEKKYIFDPAAVAGPSGEKLTSVNWKFNGSREFAKEAFDRYVLDIAAEELDHAAIHHHEIVEQVIGKQGILYLQGLGMPDKPEFSGTYAMVSAVTPFSIHTPNCHEWIRNLDLDEVKSIVRAKTDYFNGLSDGKLRRYTLNASELDEYFLKLDDGDVITKEFTESYPARILAEEYLRRGISFP